jgi:ATP-dependent Lon protease
MKTIQEELGGVSNEQESEDMRARSKSKVWNEEQKHILKKRIFEITKNESKAPDFGIQRNYLDLFSDLLGTNILKINLI